MQFYEDKVKHKIKCKVTWKNRRKTSLFQESSYIQLTLVFKAPSILKPFFIPLCRSKTACRTGHKLHPACLEVEISHRVTFQQNWSWN